jgi:hypothetical protein
VNGFDRFEDSAKRQAEQKLFVPATPAQEASRTRNWGIRNLRALYALSYQVAGARGDAIRALIDEECAARGARTYAEHAEAVAARWKKQESGEHAALRNQIVNLRERIAHVVNRLDPEGEPLPF